MRTTVLVEDVSTKNGLGAEHGLSFYVERRNERWLFDLGASDLFARNARLLNRSIEDVDAIFLSHGHRDHTGGLRAFFQLNSRAVVYATPKTFRPYYSLRKNGCYENIGTPRFDNDPLLSKRIVLNNGCLKISQQAFLFSDLKTNYFLSEANDALFVDANYSDAQDRPISPFYVRDPFEHEQSLVVTSENGQIVLFVGCSHRGIVNIVNRCVEIMGREPDFAIGGFHLMIPSRGETVSSDTLDDIANSLKNWKTQYIMGHCVGRDAFERVRVALGDQISYFETGDVFDF